MKKQASWFGRSFELGEILCGILIEITDARLAAEADLLTLVIDHCWWPHLSELFIRYNAFCGRIGDWFGGMDGCREQRSACESRQNVQLHPCKSIMESSGG
jgi:hypothetical protein